jgi:hypothetical protein
MEILDVGMYACYLLFFVAVIAAVGFPVLQIVQNPKALIKSGIGLVSLAILFIIAFALSGSEVTPKYTTMGVGESGSKLIGAGLIMFYCTLIIAVIGMIISEINKALK